MTTTACDDQLRSRCQVCGIDFARPHQADVPDGYCTRCWQGALAFTAEQDRLADAWDAGEKRIDRIAQSDASGDHYADAINPQHYRNGGIECIDALAAATVNKRGIEAVCTANVIKYLWRYESKNGAEDVRKARWYIERLLSELEANGYHDLDGGEG